MKRYENLEFFNKAGNSCNFIYDTINEYWTGALYLNKVSVGLIETEQIIILEKILDEYNNVHYVYPHITNINTDKISVGLYDNSTENIFLFSIDNSTMELKTLVEYALDVDPSETIVGNLKQSNVLNQNYLNINIGAQSNVENILSNYIVIKDLNYDKIIAIIQIYCEAVGEDLRLKVLCDNFGYRLTLDDSKIFSDSDVIEEMPDYQIFNRKRKELLLEGSNIFPFIGSYKGLINAINYFGFSDLDIKEYWKNIDLDSSNYGKLKQITISKVFDDYLNIKDATIDYSKFRKTNKIALSYKINRITDNYDSYGQNVIEDVYQYTIEEVLIKLYALKNKLKETFLPYNIEIKDIVGEADFNALKQTSLTLSSNTLTKVDSGIEPKIEILSKNEYIVDLRDFDDLVTKYDFEPGFVRELYGDSQKPAEELKDVILAAFRKYYPGLNTIESIPENETMTIGCPIVIKNTSFDTIIKDLNLTFNQISGEGDFIIDFVPLNIGDGDIFKIKELISETEIEYVCDNTDTIDTVLERLLDLFSNNIDIPWVFFVPSIVTDNGVKLLRIFGKGLNDIKFDFKSEVINGESLNDQSFEKYYQSTTNTQTYKNIGDKNYYEVIWRIYNDDNTFNQIITGDIDYYRTISTVLPKIGKYNLELTLKDTFNMLSTKKFKDIIDVKMKEVDFVGIYREISTDYNSIKSLSDIKLNENKIVKYKPLIVNTTKLKDCNVTYSDLLVTNLLPNINYEEKLLYTVKNYKPTGHTSYPGPFTYKTIGNKVRFKDLKNQSFYMTEISGDNPMSFNIYKLFYGSKITLYDLNNNKTSHTFTTNNLKDATAELNNSTDFILSSYVYSYIEDEEKINVLIDDIEKIDDLTCRITSNLHELKEGQFLRLIDNTVTEYNIDYLTIFNVSENTFDVNLKYVKDTTTLSWNYAKFIHVVGKYYGKNCDVNKIETDNVKIADHVPSKTSGFLINDYKILNDFKIFNSPTYIVFSSTPCKISGKFKYLWKVENLLNDDFKPLYYDTNSFGYFFHVGGNYKITLTITDYNGNIKSRSKNIIKIKWL